jgi:uncharacterized protein
MMGMAGAACRRLHVPRAIQPRRYGDPVDDDVLRRVAEVVSDHPVAFSYVFGSVARGDDRANSDVDVAVHFELGMGASDRFQACLRLGGELEVALARPVDVVDLEEADLRFAGRILTERVVVTGRERVERVRWETAIYRPYVDVEFHAREMDREVLRAMAEGRG